MKKEIRNKVYKKYHGHCAYCGCDITPQSMQIDHFNPIFRGWDIKPLRAGTEDIENYYPACRSCNHRKSTLTIEQFRAELEKAHKRLMRDNKTYSTAVRFGLIGELNSKVTFYYEAINL